ncbi:hypothetical protein ACWV26_01120 [Rummeliibacillus sp. JY-2-4R]
MKKTRIGLILIAIVLIVLGWTAYQEKQDRKQINSIINEQPGVNGIDIKINKTDKTISLGKKDAVLYKEQYPLSHIEKLEKAEESLFAKKPDYIITYKKNGEELYSVEILRLLDKNKAVPKKLKPFLFTVKSASYIIYWPEQNKIFEQSENTKELLKSL